MEKFTYNLTNGIIVPPFLGHNYTSDTILKSLLKYLYEFTDPVFNVQDVRCKIKSDFNMVAKFSELK